MRGANAGDKLFLFLVLALVLVGLAIFSSATLGLLARESSSVSKDIFLQAGLGAAFGLLALFLARSVPLERLTRAVPYLYIASLIFTALVFVPGIGLHANGATRWINIGFTTIQPSEFLKIGVVLMLAWWLAPRARHLSDYRMGFVPFALIMLGPCLLLILQPNTSTMMLLAGTAAAMYFAAGAPLRDFGIMALAIALALGVLMLSHSYVAKRIETFLDPSAHALSSGYQIQQSLIAVGSGGLFGRGLGQSVEKFNYLPEPSGDSVFAVFAEETGFIGALILLCLFIGLASRGIVIAGHSRDLFGGLVALGFSCMLIVQAFVNICAMIGIIPLTGQPLPFVSHGGTALVAALIMCGLILNVARHRRG